MTDTPNVPGPPTPPSGGSDFCGECGAKLEPGAAFCGVCGTATPAAVAEAAGAGAGPGGEPSAPGASKWEGVEPVLERPGDMPPPPPRPVPVAPVGAGGPGGPPTGGPPPGGPPTGGPPPQAVAQEKKGKGPLIAVALVVLAALVGGFLLLGGDDDEVAGDDTTTTTEDPDDTTTTTEDPDDTTTTTEDPDDTTTTSVDDDPLAGIEFVPLTDATGQLTVEVPAEWSDVSLALEGADFANIQASTSLEGFRTQFEVPGMSFSLLGSAPAESFDTTLDFLAASVNLPNACVSAGKDDYTDGVFTGRFEIWQECAGIGTQIVIIVASQADGRTIEINAQIPADDPVEIVTHIAETFFIVG